MIPSPLPDRIPQTVQAIAWLAGLVACVYGMLNSVAEWSPELASVQFVILAVAPVLLMMKKMTRRGGCVIEGAGSHVALTDARDFKSMSAVRLDPWIDCALCLFCGGLSLAMSAGIGARMGNLPPAYHDEYSYLFQTETLLAGRFSFPSPTLQPELFDQMHILNEGRMASRYYPGTGLWMAPFVALGKPYLGHWIAGSLATMLIYWTGVELAGRMTAIVGSLAMALSPGVNLFGNLLLAHHPCLLGLSVFLLGIIRWRRTRAATDAWIAGCGLSFAMLCRPMTAAAFALPFGLDVLVWLSWPSRGLLSKCVPDDSARIYKKRGSTLLGLGVPLLAGWGLMISYNQAITRDWTLSPYQLYTDTYTPRHVYGFNNVIRGEQHLGPRVIEYYDKWAINLTPALARQNVFDRWLCSWLWTFDLLPILLASLVVVFSIHRWGRGWILTGASIVCLHAAHVPYWYVGIMGWHYVFETAPLWCLFLGGATQALVTGWQDDGKYGLIIWWFVFLAVSIGGVYSLLGESHSNGEQKPPRMVVGMNSIIYPRRKHAEYRQWIEERAIDRPALVLLEQDATETSHLDLVVNSPGLDGPVLLGRFRPGITSVEAVRRDYPKRSLYLANPERHAIRRID